jgi:hypothetical protein
MISKEILPAEPAFGESRLRQLSVPMLREFCALHGEV